MIIKYTSLVKEWLIENGISSEFISLLNMLLLVLIVAIIGIIANFIAKKIIVSIIGRIIKRSKNTWDDVLLEKKVFNRLSHFAPAILIYYFVNIVLIDYPNWIGFIKSATYIYVIIVSMMVICSFLDSLNDIYNSLPASQNKRRSIKGYIQGVKIILYIFGAILIFSIIFGKSPLYFLTGMGAIAAILMLVFKDTILGLVGGIQLATNDMVRLGDWISMPSKDADGTVVDISLHTVKVQNWNKSITTIPTYVLVSESFSNWRGMEESGGRRIMRSLNIDMKSIKLLNDELFEKLTKIHLINSYLITKRDEVLKYNKEHNIDESIAVNGKRLTNLGTFRKYIEEYLKTNPNIHKEMTLLVRQLQPTETGLPIQIYCFSKIQEWGAFETIQSDIFDHILAIISDFELHVFQNPSGEDFRLRTLRDAAF
ncbi:MAG: mechanosensitive ion channel protein MscS [Bacteroidetes bacterium GWF2_33_38]|nr:MAG: mechanosensitive ion channel protein MscS [Bacteroidetes bacterium GWF2_33_38]